jgi:hypothetical protein
MMKNNEMVLSRYREVREEREGEIIIIIIIMKNSVAKAMSKQMGK